jgi:glycine cleavage system H protein
MGTRYTSDHEWVVAADGVVTVGITDYAQQQLGDLVFVDLPKIGAQLEIGAVAAAVESVKAASDVLSPLSGTVIEVNSSLTADPGLVNSAPTGAGWLFKLKLSKVEELDLLLDEDAYRNLLS